MLIKKPAPIPSSEITDKSLYVNRRKFLAGAALVGGAVLLGDQLPKLRAPMLAVPAAAAKLDVAKKTDFAGGETLTP